MVSPVEAKLITTGSGCKDIPVFFKEVNDVTAPRQLDGGCDPEYASANHGDLELVHTLQAAKSWLTTSTTIRPREPSLCVGSPDSTLLSLVCYRLPWGTD